MAENRDHQRWKKFSDSPDFLEMKHQIVEVVRASQLPLSEIGESWGLTVHVDGDMVFRVNHADYALFDMRDPNERLSNRILVMAVLLDEGGHPRENTRSTFWSRRKPPYEIDTGFSKLVPGSTVLWFPASSFERVISRPEVVEGLRRHVASRPRKLFSPNRHNPLTATIFG